VYFGTFNHSKVIRFWYFLSDGGVQATKTSVREGGTVFFLGGGQKPFASQPFSKVCIDYSYRAETTSPRCLNVNVVDFQPRGLSPEASEFIPAAQVCIFNKL